MPQPRFDLWTIKPAKYLGREVEFISIPSVKNIFTLEEKKRLEPRIILNVLILITTLNLKCALQPSAIKYLI